MAVSVLDSGNTVLQGDFAKFVADEQKQEAFTMKQQRLYAEEEEKRLGKGPKGDAGGKGDKNDWRGPFFGMARVLGEMGPDPGSSFAGHCMVGLLSYHS